MAVFPKDGVPSSGSKHADLCALTLGQSHSQHNHPLGYAVRLVRTRCLGHAWRAFRLDAGVTL